MKTKTFSVAVLALFVATQDASCYEGSVSLTSASEITKMADRKVKHLTDANYFRAQAMGTATHQNTAKIKAQMAANTELFRTVWAWVDEFMGNYVESVEQNAEDYVLTFEANNKETLEKKLFDDLDIAFEKVEYNREEGLYAICLVVEVKRKKVFEAFASVFSADSQCKNIYDQKKMEALFKKLF